MKWFLGVGLLLLVALIFDLGLLAYAMYVLAGVMLISRLLSRAWAGNLQAQRQCSAIEANVGDQVTVMLTLDNSGSLPIPWVLIEDVLPKRATIGEPPPLDIQGKRLQLSKIPGRGRKTVIYQMACNRRGYYQLGPAVLETGDLFGLHRRYRVAAEPSFLMVYPDVKPLEGFEIASRRPIGEVRMTYRLFEDPTRIAGVRQYQEGDPLGRVHWRATARTGVLHSKVYEPSSVAGATILLDFHRDSHDRRHEPVRSELAITAAASIAGALDQMGKQVGLISNGRDAADRIRQEGWTHDARTRAAALKSAASTVQSDRLQPVIVPTRRSDRQLPDILTALARLELTDGLPLPQLAIETASRMPRDASVIVVLPTVTDKTAIALQNLSRRGLAVVAVVNLYEEVEFADAAGRLLAAGIPAHHLKEEKSIGSVCRRMLLE